VGGFAHFGVVVFVACARIGLMQLVAKRGFEIAGQQGDNMMG